MKKKRYCLVSFCNIYLLPYAKIYIDAINSAGAECDLLFWDRDAVNGENDKFDNCNKLYYQKNKVIIREKAIANAPVRKADVKTLK